VEDHDAALADAAILKVGGTAHSGIPTAVADGDVVRSTYDLTGSQRAHLTQGLDYTTSSVESREKSPTGLDAGSQAIAAAATALNAGASLPCVRVHIVARPTNVSYITVGDSGILLTTGVRLYPGDSITLELDDCAKAYGFAANANDVLDWTCETR